MEAALLEIVEGRLSVKKTSLKFGIPVGTLWNKYHGAHFKSVGRPAGLSKSFENELVLLINTCSEWGFPLLKFDV